MKLANTSTDLRNFASSTKKSEYSLETAFFNRIHFDRHLNTNISVLLHKNGQVVADQSDFEYSWTTTNDVLLNLYPFNACIGGVQPPCPFGHVSITANTVGQGQVNVIVKQKSTGKQVAQRSFGLVADDKDYPTPPKKLDDYQNLSFGVEIRGELVKTDYSFAPRGKADLFKVVLPPRSSYDDVHVYFESCNDDYSLCGNKSFSENAHMFDSSFKYIKSGVNFDFDAITVTSDKTYYFMAASNGNYKNIFGKYKLFFGLE